MATMQDAKEDPFIVGKLDDSPTEAAKRQGWEIDNGHRRIPSIVYARGKAGLYRIVAGHTGCKAYLVTS